MVSEASVKLQSVILDRQGSRPPQAAEGLARPRAPVDAVPK